MDAKFVIYDPPMCCSSGMCGPNPDQTLINFQRTLAELRELGVKVERYIITQSPQKFKENPEVMRLIQKHQLKALPITTYNGNVVKMGAYPTLEEFKRLNTNINVGPLSSMGIVNGLGVMDE